MTYSFNLTGYDPKVPSSDTEDCREEGRDMITLLLARGHVVTSATVNGKNILPEPQEDIEIVP